MKSLYKITRLQFGRLKQRLCVGLNMSHADKKRGIFIDKPGTYLFRGAWYGKDMHVTSTFGKVEGRLNSDATFVRKIGNRIPKLLRKKI